MLGIGYSECNNTEILQKCQIPRTILYIILVQTNRVPLFKIYDISTYISEMYGRCQVQKINLLPFT